MLKTTVKIEGMACNMCEAHINDALRSAFPEAKKVASSHTKGEATFLTEAPVSADALRSAIEQSGYTYRSSETVPFEKKSLFGKVFGK